MSRVTPGYNTNQNILRFIDAGHALEPEAPLAQDAQAALNEAAPPAAQSHADALIASRVHAEAMARELGAINEAALFTRVSFNALLANEAHAEAVARGFRFLNATPEDQDS